MSTALDSLVSPFHFFQNAYAVTDIDAAIQVAARLYGIDSFQVNRDVSLQTAAGSARAHFALAFVGETQIELIQPAGGSDAAYRYGLPADGFGMRLHHLGHWTSDPEQWQRIVAAVKASGFATPVSGTFEHDGTALMHYLYADTRALLGHYLEFMYQTPAGAGLFAQVPRHRAS